MLGIVSWVLGFVCWVSGIVFRVSGFVSWVSGSAGVMASGFLDRSWYRILFKMLEDQPCDEVGC